MTMPLLLLDPPTTELLALVMHEVAETKGYWEFYGEDKYAAELLADLTRAPTEENRRNAMARIRQALGEESNELTNVRAYCADGSSLFECDLSCNLATVEITAGALSREAILAAVLGRAVASDPFDEVEVAMNVIDDLAAAEDESEATEILLAVLRPTAEDTADTRRGATCVAAAILDTSGAIVGQFVLNRLGQWRDAVQSNEQLRETARATLRLHVGLELSEVDPELAERIRAIVTGSNAAST